MALGKCYCRLLGGGGLLCARYPCKHTYRPYGGSEALRGLPYRGTSTHRDKGRKWETSQCKREPPLQRVTVDYERSVVHQVEIRRRGSNQSIHCLPEYFTFKSSAPDYCVPSQVPLPTGASSQMSVLEAGLYKRVGERLPRIRHLT